MQHYAKPTLCYVIYAEYNTSMVCRCTGPYVATLSILVKRDLPWIIVVFLVLNFSLGGGLYFAFLGENNANSASNTNTTK